MSLPDDDAAELLKLRIDRRKKAERNARYKILHVNPALHHAVKVLAAKEGKSMPETADAVMGYSLRLIELGEVTLSELS